MTEMREVEVFIAQGEIEAQLMRSFLEGHGIVCRIAGEAVRVTHGFTVDGLGQARLMVPEDLAETAKELIASAKAGELALDDDEEIEPGQGQTCVRSTPAESAPQEPTKGA